MAEKELEPNLKEGRAFDKKEGEERSNLAATGEEKENIEPGNEEPEIEVEEKKENEAEEQAPSLLPPPKGKKQK